MCHIRGAKFVKEIDFPITVDKNVPLGGGTFQIDI